MLLKAWQSCSLARNLSQYLPSLQETVGRLPEIGQKSP